LTKRAVLVFLNPVKILVILVLLLAVGLLLHDDIQQRDTLAQASHDRDDAQQEVDRLNAIIQTPRPDYIPSATSPPNWFQQRLQEKTSLDAN
jgi:hypothetical protein